MGIGFRALWEIRSHHVKKEGDVLELVKVGSMVSEQANDMPYIRDLRVQNWRLSWIEFDSEALSDYQKHCCNSENDRRHITLEQDADCIAHRHNRSCFRDSASDIMSQNQYQGLSLVDADYDFWKQPKGKNSLRVYKNKAPTDALKQ